MPRSPTIDNEIQLISDGEGLAVIGEPGVVDLFLASEGLVSRDLGLPRLQTALSSGAAVSQAGSELAASSGRWVKLTKESAQLVDKHGLRRSGQSGLETGVIRGKKGQVKGFVEFARTPGASITNPAVLAGAAGIMAQVAMQQTMDEITDYLAAIDEKVDDVLRAQKDAVLAKMIGVGFVIEEAMTTREHGGRVNEVTWSKVQGAPGTIAETQAYALRQLDALAEKLEGKAKVGDLAKAAREAESTAQEWLAVLARCFQLQEAIAVIELDRVLDAAPDDLDGHRRGLQAARRDRLEVISRCTEHLLARMDAAAATANKQVLTHPSKSREVVASSNHVAGSVGEFRERLGIAANGQSWEARRWSEAAGEVRDKVLETGVEGVTAVRRAGAGGFERARSATGRVSERLGDRTFRRRSQESTADEADDEA